MAKRGKREKKGEARIDLLGTVDLLQGCMTQAVCQEVFQQTHSTERGREWTLKALADFWSAVILRAPASLTTALYEAQEGTASGWPSIPPTSKQAFFQRCTDLRWEFFANLYAAVRDQLVRVAPCAFAEPIHPLLENFSNIWAIDGSRLDAVAHRLKILWDVRSSILPGCLEVCYDLVRGIPSVFHFHPDAAAAEIGRARAALREVPAGTLLLGDRLYSSVEFFGRLTSQGIYGLFRRNATVKLRKIKRLKRQRIAGGILEDWLVEAGTGQTAEVQQLRWICFRLKGARQESLSNVLDPNKLPADLAWALYPWRWKIERMFYDLKEVLNLHCFYAGSPNAVAMQVYTAAMVYSALRVAQGQAAQQVGITAEEISTEKFFPKVAASSFTWTVIQLTTRAIVQANQGKKLRQPKWKQRRFASVPLSAVRVEHRNEKRRRRRYCASRARWKSFRHVPHGRAFLGSLS